jgi:hypothetical protein
VRYRAWPFLLLAALLAAALWVQPAFAAAAKKPPRAGLRANGESARLGPWTYRWQYGAGWSGCQIIIADGTPSYEPRLSVPHRHARPRVVFLRDREPRVERFRAYSEIGDEGTPEGSGRRVRSQVQPKRRGGEIVAWAIRFRVDVVDRPYFDLDVSFQPRGRCREGGSGSYSFGLERE